MKQRISLDHVLATASRGCAISEEYVLSAIESFFELPMESILYPAEGRDYWDHFRESLAIDAEGKTVKEVMRFLSGHFRNRVSQAQITLLGFPGTFFKQSLKKCGDGPEVQVYRDKVLPFFRLTVEDYMRALGATELYELWFAKDATLWEKDKGKAPTIGDLMLYCCQRIIRMSGDFYMMVYPLFQRSCLTGDYAELPFFRELCRNEYPKEFEPTRIKQYQEFKNGTYLSTLVWILMVEAPTGYFDRPEWTL